MHLESDVLCMNNIWRSNASLYHMFLKWCQLMNRQAIVPACDEHHPKPTQATMHNFS